MKRSSGADTRRPRKLVCALSLFTLGACGDGGGGSGYGGSTAGVVGSNGGTGAYGSNEDIDRILDALNDVLTVGLR
jgi:hypothetical protein